MKIVYKVEANGVFAQIPARTRSRKSRSTTSSMCGSKRSRIVRWMCSFDTTEEDIRDFAKVVAEAVKG